MNIAKGAARRYTHRVIRVSDRTDCGEHTSLELARKRLGRLLAMSNGRHTETDYRIVEIGTEANP